MTRIRAAIEESMKKVRGDDTEHYTGRDFNSGLCGDVSQAVIEILPEAEERVSDFPGHYYVKYRGRYYDSEALVGVCHPNQLPIFRREFSRIRKK